MEHSYVHYATVPGSLTAQPEEESSNAWIWIIVVVLILIVIGVAIWWSFTGGGGGTTTGSNMTWNIINGTGAGSDRFNASAGNAYLAPSGATGNFTLQLIPPANAKGQQFLIINDSSATITGTITGGSSITVPPRRNYLGLWMSPTAVNQINQAS